MSSPSVGSSKISPQTSPNPTKEDGLDTVANAVRSHLIQLLQKETIRNINNSENENLLKINIIDTKTNKSQQILIEREVFLEPFKKTEEIINRLPAPALKYFQAAFKRVMEKIHSDQALENSYLRIEGPDIKKIEDSKVIKGIILNVMLKIKK